VNHKIVGKTYGLLMCSSAPRIKMETSPCLDPCRAVWELKADKNQSVQVNKLEMLPQKDTGFAEQVAGGGAPGVVPLEAASADEWTRSCRS
jgi:hypothetical protein